MSRARDIANLQSSKITADAGIDIDNINIDGTTIALSSGNLTLDVAGDIVLDAADNEIVFNSSGAQIGYVSMASSNLTIVSTVSNKDIIFKGSDAGSEITALTLDMSEAGAATFNSAATFGGAITANSATSTDANTTTTNSQINSRTLHLRTRGDSAGISGQTYSNQIISSNGTNVALEIYTIGATGTPVVFGTNSTERMRINGTGVGIGVTAHTAKLQIVGENNASSTPLGKIANSQLHLDHTTHNNAIAQIGFGYPGSSATFSAASIGFISTLQDSFGKGDLFFATRNVNTDSVPTERMRITSDGQVLCGSTTADSHIKILSAGTNTTNYIALRNTTAADSSGARYSYVNYEGTQSGGEISTLAQIGAEHQGTADDEKGNLVFTTNDGNDGDSPNERMRIGNNGRITSTTIVDDWNLVLSNGNSAPYGQSISWGSAAPDNNTSIFLYCADSSVARLYIYADGDVVNHDNSYGSISDERIKQDIVDANSQWDDIKAVKVRNYKKKDDVEQYGDKAGSQIGVIAQELEAVSPKLVKEASPSASDIRHSAEFGTLYEDGDTIPDGKEVGDVKEIKENVKKVSYSVLYMKAIKALQEAMTRIETLEAKVAKLEE